MSTLFAATYPQRVSHLVLIGGFARSSDRISEEVWQTRLEQAVKDWGTGEMMKAVAPSQIASPATVAQFAKFERLSSSPGAFKTILLLNRQIDVTSILPTLQVPTNQFLNITNVSCVVQVKAPSILKSSIGKLAELRRPKGT